jgi:hypothetical protein
MNKKEISFDLEGKGGAARCLEASVFGYKPTG